MQTRFPLAPMDPTMRIMTLICYAIPAIIGGLAVAAPGAVRPIMLGTTAVIVGLYAAVWFWFRPREFVLDADGLELVWPARRRRILAQSIVGARVVDLAQLRRELRYLLRIGAGGLWGGFGLAKTARGTLELWVSRTSQIVWIECEGRRSLLITPADPERFVRELPTRDRALTHPRG